MALKEFIKKHRPTLVKPHIPSFKKAPTHRAGKIKRTKSLEETVAELNKLTAEIDSKAS